MDPSTIIYLNSGQAGSIGFRTRTRTNTSFKNGWLDTHQSNTAQFDVWTGDTDFRRHFLVLHHLDIDL